ncbi:MAG TPA: hypothetical protein VGR57_09950, partial [Ktedonobacterales bacterium]|nr:hypothetical protein [Ktedonobacterales bacterium]
MLTPEQAKAALEAHRDPADEQRRLALIPALQAPARAIAYALLGREADGSAGKSHPVNGSAMPGAVARHQWAAQRLDDLTSAERLPIFSVFFPALAEAVEAGWQFHRSQPYTSPHAQAAPFRAPGRPEVTLGQRQTWLLALIGMVGPYHEDVRWLARHAAYLHDYYGRSLGLLFAAVIDGDPARGDELFDLLLAAARGEDAVAGYGRYIPAALLAASRPAGWECVERVLLGAQREEGVRQTILEALGTAHPQAFAQLLALIEREQLTRFSAITRAVNGWLGTTWDSAQAPAVARAVASLRQMLSDAGERERALASGSGEEAYLALWAMGMADIYAALPLAERLLDDPAPARRYAAARLLASAYVPEAIAPLARALRDADQRVAAQAGTGLQVHAYPAARQGTAHQFADTTCFEAIEGALPGIPVKPLEAPPLMWNVPVPPVTRAGVANLLLTFLGERDPQRLIAHLGAMSGYGRVNAAKRLAERDWNDGTVRLAILDLVRDRSHWVSAEALKLLAAAP